MKGPSLQKTAALSAALHVTAFLISALILRQNTHLVLPSPYVVNLVTKDIGPHETEKSKGPAEQAPPKPVEEERDIPKSKKVSRIDERRIDEMIAAIEAKKRIERIDKLRKEISIGKSERPESKTLRQNRGVKPSSSYSGTTSAMTYEDRIRDEIHRQWFWPDTGRKDLETIITVTIRKDGTIPLQNIVMEKPSVSRLFNKYAVEAIAKASPVTPPPHGEFSIGIRFYP